MKTGPTEKPKREIEFRRGNHPRDWRDAVFVNQRFTRNAGLTAIDRIGSTGKLVAMRQTA